MDFQLNCTKCRRQAADAQSVEFACGLRAKEFALLSKDNGFSFIAIAVSATVSA
jgi:hypothetical protein